MGLITSSWCVGARCEDAPLRLAHCGVPPRRQYDIKNKRTFLKRVHYPDVTLKDIHLGAKLVMCVGPSAAVAAMAVIHCRCRSCSYGRQMTVLSYEDEATRRALEGHAHRQCFAAISAPADSRLGAVWAAINAAGVQVANARSVDISPIDATRLLGSADWCVSNAALTAPACHMLHLMRCWPRRRVDLRARAGRATVWSSSCWGRAAATRGQVSVAPRPTA